MRIVDTSGFRRRAAKLRAEDKALLRQALERLEANPFDPALRTHRLHGPLSGRWAFSVGQRLRVVCVIRKDEVHLVNIGTHDEVY